MVDRASFAAWQSDGASSSIGKSAVGAVITELADKMAVVMNAIIQSSIVIKAACFSRSCSRSVVTAHSSDQSTLLSYSRGFFPRHHFEFAGG